MAVRFAATCVPRSVEDHEIQLGGAHAIGPPPVAVREGVELQESLGRRTLKKVYGAFFCVSQQGEFKNTIKNFLGKIYVKNFWPKKLREKKLFSFRLFPSTFFYRVFGRFST